MNKKVNKKDSTRVSSKVKKTTNKTETTRKRNKRVDGIILGVLCGFIVLFGAILIFLNNSYFNVNLYVYDYLTMELEDYSEDSDNCNLINRKDNKCHILFSSKFLNEYNKSIYALDDSYDKEFINGHEWVKSEYENGITLETNHNDVYYIVQLYAEDEEVYNSDCKQDFDKIKSTFSFENNE